MNPLAFLAPYKLLIELLVIGAIVGAAIWGVHSFLMHEQQIGYDRAVAEYTAKVLEAEKAARVIEAQLRTQIEEARNAAAERDKTIRSLSASARVSSASLSDAINATRNSVPGATAASLARSVDALAAVSDQCQGRYREVAEIADRHASDAKTLYDGWPVTFKKE